MDDPPIQLLVVEDNDADAEYLREVLREAAQRFDIAHTETLADAKRLVAERGFDVVLLDLSLPDSRGLATVDEMLRAPAAPPVVVLTGNVDDENAVAALQRGAQDYLVKGDADARLLVRTIRYAIERRRAELATREKEAAEKARAETERLNRALAETNRAILALYQELDERTEFFKRASDLKSKFLSNMSHEFRTPLNSILGLSGLLQSHADGPLSAEQEKQVAFIHASAQSLSTMVDDLLDLARIEAGKAVVHVEDFDVSEVFDGLRGMFRAIQRDNQDVRLVFDDVAALPRLRTDQSKLTQILRNFVTNALKFTERGSVHVSARAAGPDRVVLSVTDTGIGIAPDDLDRIFVEFAQIESVTQRRVKGTGLGLPLCKNLAKLLGGDVTVTSELGKGSTFSVEIPRTWAPGEHNASALVPRPQLDPSRSPVLVVEDDVDTLFIYERHLRGSGFQVLPATTLDDARRVLSQITPVAVVLDVLLERESSWDFLAELKRNERTAALPVLVVSVLDGRQHAFALGAEEFCSKPVEKSWLLARLQTLAVKRAVRRVLIIDDEEVARYLVKGFLAGLPYEVIEANGGRDGIAKAIAERPDVIFLDIVMPDLTAFEVLGVLAEDPATRDIPVIINTSKRLDADERDRLARSSAAIIDKNTPSRQEAVARIQEALQQAGVAPPRRGAEGPPR